METALDVAKEGFDAVVEGIESLGTPASESESGSASAQDGLSLSEQKGDAGVGKTDRKVNQDRKAASPGRIEELKKARAEAKTKAEKKSITKQTRHERRKQQRSEPHNRRSQRR